MSVGNSGPRVSAYILAGGGSTRFGRDKALVDFAGKPMLERMVELMRSFTKRVNVVSAPAKYAEFGVEIVADRWPREGPLGGIITALQHAQEIAQAFEWHIIVSCDMPFLTVDWMKFLAERTEKSDAQVILPHSAHGPEPMCACYRTSAGPRLRDAFEGGVRKVTQALKQVHTEVLDERDWKRFDSAGRLFWNMNTAADYAEARRIVEAEQS